MQPNTAQSNVTFGNYAGFSSLTPTNDTGMQMMSNFSMPTSQSKSDPYSGLNMLSTPGMGMGAGTQSSSTGGLMDLTMGSGAQSMGFGS